MHESSKNILEVKGLQTILRGNNKLLDDVGFSIERGCVLGVVGKTGSGKSITAMSILGLLDFGSGTVQAEKVKYYKDDGTEIDLQVDEKIIQSELRAKEIAIIFQNPRNALDAVRKCGRQISRIIKKHFQLDKLSITNKVLELFEEVGLEDQQRIFDSYPHQLSGGEMQRVLIALSLACDPKLLILDEPTSSLDLLVQKKILELLIHLKDKRQLSMLLISHNLPLISQITDQIIHIDSGKIVSRQSTKDFFLNPKGEIAVKLMEQLNRNLDYEGVGSESAQQRIVEVKDLRKTYSRRTLLGQESKFVALKNINLDIYQDDSVGIVGESGSGKSTLARCIAGLTNFDSGTVNHELSSDKIVYVFQDSYTSMDPELTISAILHEVARIHSKGLSKEERRRGIVEKLEVVGLDASFLERRTNQISGGQRQRVSLCRALLAKPELLICDEITTGLDLIVQFEIINLLKEIASNLTLIFISHDISLIKRSCNKILVMKDGAILEAGATNAIFENPRQNYTAQLINSIVKVKYFLNR